MMHEDLIKELNEEKKMGLDLKDTAYYNVDDGVTDEPLLGDETDEVVVDPGDNGGRRKSNKGRTVAAFILGMLFTLGVLLIASNVFGFGRFVTGEEYKYLTDVSNSYGKYYEIMQMIDADPIAEKDPDDISDEELKRIVSSIGDPYAEYYTAEEYEQMERRLMGDYVGIGIGVVQEEENVVIKEVFADSPAEKAGIQAEDIIIGVDGKKPADVDDAVSMITGEAGTKVTVTVKRGDETLDFDLTRQQIETDSIAYDVLEGHDDVGYILISSFVKDTDDDFKLAVKDLKSKGCTKFIIDLRNNGGGLTDSSIEIADYLLPACKIMSENTKNGKETVYNSKASSADLEMVILVNENTASASEILAAALQDNNAGAIIGTKTFGKGVTQLMHKFPDDTAIKITVTEYFRPSGKTVHGVGITPDIEAEGEEVLDAALKELGE